MGPVAGIPRDQFPRRILVISSRGSSRGCRRVGHVGEDVTEDPRKETDLMEFKLMAACR